jgi:hypothetical protein
MKRPTLFSEATAGQNAAPQMQRMQHNDRNSNFTGRPDTDRGHSYISSRAEDQWQWDRDTPNSASSHPYMQGQGGNMSQSLLQGRMAEYRKVDLEKQTSNENRLQSQEQEMEIGYEDKPIQLTYEALEHKLQEEIMRLVKEQYDAEDKENARHKEKIVEINGQYQEKLSSLRTRHAKQREECLRKESQERLHLYHQQQSGMESGVSNARGYGVNPAAEAHRSYGGSVQYESYKERSPYVPETRASYPEPHLESRVQYPESHLEGRVPYPEGRVYNNPAPRYYQ